MSRMGGRKAKKRFIRSVFKIREAFHVPLYLAEEMLWQSKLLDRRFDAEDDLEDVIEQPRSMRRPLTKIEGGTFSQGSTPYPKGDPWRKP